MDNPSQGTIRWSLIRTRAPGTLGTMIDEIERACDGNPEDPARAIELTLRQQLSQLQAKFDLLKTKEKSK